MKKWLVTVVIALVLSSFFISLAVEKKSGKVTPSTKEMAIEKKLDKIMKQNESILKELKKIEEDLTFMKKELRIIKGRA